MEIDNYLSLIAIVISVISIVVSSINSHKIAKVQIEKNKQENNRLRLIDIKEKLTDLGFQYDNLLNEASSLAVSDKEEDLKRGAELFKESANVLNSIIILYENNRGLFSLQSRTILDEMDKTMRMEDNNDNMIPMIEFIQKFNQLVEKETI